MDEKGWIDRNGGGGAERPAFKASSQQEGELGCHWVSPWALGALDGRRDLDSWQGGRSNPLNGGLPLFHTALLSLLPSLLFPYPLPPLPKPHPSLLIPLLPTSPPGTLIGPALLHLR